MSDWKYSALEYTDEPSYKASIMLGNHLMQHMGELDNNWIRMYVIDRSSKIFVTQKANKIFSE